MRTFDLIKFFFEKINPLGLHDLRKKSSKQFYGRWAWCPHDDVFVLIPAKIRRKTQ